MENNSLEKELISFIEDFFKSLSANLSWEDEVLVISNVPHDFEEQLGKKSPYRLRFKKEGDDTSEFVTKGSVFLKTVMSILEEKGKATLIKIPFKREYRSQIERHLSLKNGTISSYIEKEEQKGFVRFTLATTLQYLNEKEQLTNQIVVSNNEIVDFDIDKYETIEGKKEEAPKISLKEDFELAKNELKKKIEKRINETTKLLENKLENEVKRIKQHYEKQRQEEEDALKKVLEQKKNLELQKDKIEREEPGTYAIKLNKITQSIALLNKDEHKEALTKEESFFIADEKQKHTLRVSNKLINTTIIYYPIYHFQITIKSDSLKKLELVYDPLRDELIKKPLCESCHHELRNVTICTANHAVCSNCTQRCMQCSSPLCLICPKKNCDLCSKKLCKKCGSKCPLCWKTICKSHSVENYVDGKDYCTMCLKKCTLCGKYADNKHIKLQNNQDVCERCIRTAILRK